MAFSCLWLLPALLMFGLLQTSTALFEVKDSGNKVCILANLSVDFSVLYNEFGNKEAIATFNLPGNATVHNSSTCGNISGSTPLLAIAFGDQHILSMHFNKTSAAYHVINLTFSYSLSDKAFFPNSSDNGTRAASSLNTGISALMNTTYRCISEDRIDMGQVNVTLHQVLLEAYLPKNNFSTNETKCKKDEIVTTTSEPVTNSTVQPTTQPTTPTPPTPTVGTYNVSDVNGTCLLISAGLQLNITYTNKNNKTELYVFDLDPALVSQTGNCTPLPTITLAMKSTTLLLTFYQNATSNSVFLETVNVTTSLPPDAKGLTFSNSSDTFYLAATVGKSYKCKAKQTLQITNEFSINTFNLQVQAFSIRDGKFGAVEECQLDENSMLVPIIVGAALAGLVLIVLIAYLIGRKRSHAGYQTI